MFHTKIHLLNATYHVLLCIVKQFLPTCLSQWESIYEINSLKVKISQPSQCRNGRLQITRSIEKKLKLIMFFEILRHSQAATRIYVAYAFCLLPWLLTSLRGNFLKNSKLSNGKCPLSFQNFQTEGNGVVSVEVSKVSHGDRTQCSNFQIHGIPEWKYVWISDWWCATSTGECQNS